VPNQTVSPGTLLAGRYRIAEQLAEYGDARVWRAVDEVLSRAVAVDVLDADDPRSDRLYDAARRAATAADSRFLRVLDCSAYDGVTYCVREWAGGRSLERMLANGPLTGQQAGWLTREVAEALELLHRSGGQPHGAISPATVVVTDTGAIKIVGLATEAALRRPDGPGSPAEDIRDLGRVLYACLTARWPGGPAYGLQAAPLEHGRLMSPRQVRAGVPRSLDDIADRLLGAPPRHHAAPITSAAGLSAALAGVIGHSHEPPGQINDQPNPAARPDGSVDDDATVFTPVVNMPPAVVPPPSYDPYAPTQQVQPVATAGQPTTTAPRPVASAPPYSPVRRAAAQGSGGASGYGTVNGGRRRNDPNQPRDRRGGWGGRILILLAVLALLSVIAMAQFLLKNNVGDGGTSDNNDNPPPATTSAPASTTANIVGARDVDPPPEGSGEEHRKDVPKTYDGKQSTTWTTMSYSNANFGDEKPGVGLVYDLGSVTSVSKVTVSVRRDPYEFEIRIPSGDTSESPADPDDWEAQGEAKDTTEETVTVSVAAGTRTRYVMIWLTKIPKESGGDYRGEIAEVSIQK
jgi:hypothetical protein